MRRSRGWLSLVSATALLFGCAGGGQSFSSIPNGNGAITSGAGFSPSGATMVRVHLPWVVPTAPPTGRSTPVGTSLYGPGTFPGATPTPFPTVAPISAPNGSPAPIAAIAVSVNGPTPVNQTISLGAGSASCLPATTGSICQFPLGVGPGTYTASVTLYSMANASPLSTIGSPQTIAFNVVAGTANVVNLSIGAVPAEVALAPATTMSAQNSLGGIDVYGAGKHQFVVELLDSNDYIIVGAGPLNYSLTPAGGQLSLNVVSSTSFTPNQAINTAPNLFTVTYTGPALNNATGSLRAGVTPAGSAQSLCFAPGAVCNSTVAMEVKQLLAVANSSANTVTLYGGLQNLPLATIQNGLINPAALVFDANGDLFIASEPNSVIEYQPPYTGLPTTIGAGVNHPQALALDSKSDLFVANGNGSNTVTEYVAPYTGAPESTISTGIDDPVSLGIDGSANLYVANQAANTVTVYAAPYSGTPTTVSNGLNGPNSVALDAHGNLFVSNLNSTPNSVLEYAPPFSSSSIPSAWITNGINEQGAIAVNGASNLFVPNQGANSVTAYAPPFSSVPTTIKGGQSQPVALAIDAAGVLYVANYGNNSVTAYPPPYAGVSWITLSTGITNPQALALSPATSL